MRRVIRSMLLFALFFSGCAEYSIPEGVNLNRYSYVAMPPLSMFKEQGFVTRQDTMAAKERFAKLFEKEDLKVLDNWKGVDNVPLQDRMQVLLASFQYNAGIVSTATLVLYDLTDEEVFSSTAEYDLNMTLFGGTARDSLFGAIDTCFSAFRNNYSGFDVGSAREYAKEMEGKSKTYPTIDINEVDLQKYLEENVSSLDPIEGIWLLNQDELYTQKWGIVKDGESSTRDFVVILLETFSPLEKAKQVGGEFLKTAHDGVYLGTFYSGGRPKYRTNSVTINSEGLLEISITNPKSGEMVTLSYMKLYPHNVVSSPASEPAPQKTTATGTGFIVSSDGIIVTAYHLVKDKTEIRVKAEGEDWLPATLEKHSFSNDVAVLRTDKATPNYLLLGDFSTVQQGEKVFTLGYPVVGVLGDEPKYTEGTISSLSGIMGEDSLIQISVPVQPGNSGGPLVTASGDIVGMITSTAAVRAFFEQTGALPQNVNWAVKSNYIVLLLPKDYGSKPDAESKSTDANPVDIVRQSICFVEAK